MADYWDNRRDGIMTRSTPWAVDASESAGLVHVRGELIVSAEAAGALDLAARRFFSLKDGGQDWLVDPDGVQTLQLWTYSGAIPIPQLAFHMRVASGDQRIAPHYVLTGEPKPTVPRGGPFGPPEPHAPVDLPASWGGGDDLMVAVLDTGLDPLTPPGGQTAGVDRVRWDHVADRDHLGSGVNAPAGGPLAAEAGHGSFITALIHRLAGGGVSMAAVRVLDSDGIGSEEMLVRGLKRLREEFPSPPRIVNLSLGAFTDNGGWLTTDEDERQLLFPISQRDLMPLGVANELAHWSSGALAQTVFVCAAGNDGLTRPFWPAAAAGSPIDPPRLPIIVSVGSLGVDGTPSAFSNRGDWVRVSTRGERILSSYSQGQMTDEAGQILTFPPGGAALWTGTSFAAPVVTSELARRCRDDGVTGADAWRALEPILVPLVPAAPGMGSGYDAFAQRGVKVGD